jgi:putative ATP-dependent endonuclease of OLD family
MQEFKNPYISRVKIKNFRNFLNVDVLLDHKQVIIGENNVGKTNFLRAIQLILDRDFSDNDRQLIESDFHHSLEMPMINGDEIEIILEIRGYEHNSKLVAQFEDALISSDPPTLQFRYGFFPNLDQFGNILNYKFEIHKGTNNLSKFTSEDRSYINIYVIKALRDVERELKANKNSPLFKLIKKYDIPKEDLEGIAETIKLAGDEILKLDEIQHVKKALQSRFDTLSGLQNDNEISLRTFDVDTERLLYSLQVYMGLKERPIAELSLGLANILYVSLMLILLKDRTIPPILKPEQFETLKEEDDLDLLVSAYTLSDRGNYVLNENISVQKADSLYEFMDQNNPGNVQSFTILAVEEPESHLHPVLQRLIYREVLHKSGTSVIFTSHSTYITSVAPLSSIVHIRYEGLSSKIYSTVNLKIGEQEKKDIERYLDAKRGEIYFGKGIMLVEGITEEYFIAAAADLSGQNLDDVGIVVCNIDSTNFSPYVQLLNSLNIPWCLFTDGDYYQIVTTTDEETGEEKRTRKYHILHSDVEGGYRGNEIICSMLIELGIADSDDISDDITEQDILLRSLGCFIGQYTLEVDMMKGANDDAKALLKQIFSDLVTGGDRMKANFNKALDDGTYWKALTKIDDNISKGRFAQRLSGSLTPELVPSYVSEGISEFVQIVRGHE